MDSISDRMCSVDETTSSHVPDTRAHSSSLFLGVRTGQVSCIVFFTSLHIFSIGSYQALAVASQGVWRRPATVAVREPHKEHEWRSGLAVNGLYHPDKASVQRAPLRSPKCADKPLSPGNNPTAVNKYYYYCYYYYAGRPVEPLYDGELQLLHGRSSPNNGQTHDHCVCGL